MDKGLKAKWVKALRSRKFKQAHKQLKTKHGYCCLGVLREIAEPGCARTDGAGLLRREDAAAWGIGEETMFRLAAMNDGLKDFAGNPHSFEQIADYIEKKL